MSEENKNESVTAQEVTDTPTEKKAVPSKGLNLGMVIVIIGVCVAVLFKEPYEAFHFPIN